MPFYLANIPPFSIRMPFPLVDSIDPSTRIPSFTLVISPTLMAAFSSATFSRVIVFAEKCPLRALDILISPVRLSDTRISPVRLSPTSMSPVRLFDTMMLP